MLKLIFLHGFLGAQEDWQEVISYLPDFRCLTLSYPFIIPSDGILVGYSMGGRIAFNYPHPKILISSHLGFTTKEEKDERRAWENRWLHRLKTEPFFKFLKAWYDQPLFSSLKALPQFPAIFNRRLQGTQKEALHQFQSNLLSDQPYQIPSHVHFLCGTEDTKYVNLYKKLRLNPLLVQGSCHACHLEQPKECANLIRQIVDNLRHLPGYQISQKPQDCQNYHQ